LGNGLVPLGNDQLISPKMSEPTPIATPQTVPRIRIRTDILETKEDEPKIPIVVEAREYYNTEVENWDSNVPVVVIDNTSSSSGGGAQNRISRKPIPKKISMQNFRESRTKTMDEPHVVTVKCAIGSSTWKAYKETKGITESRTSKKNISPPKGSKILADGGDINEHNSEKEIRRRLESRTSHLRHRYERDACKTEGISDTEDWTVEEPSTKRHHADFDDAKIKRERSHYAREIRHGSDRYLEKSKSSSSGSERIRSHHGHSHRERSSDRERSRRQYSEHIIRKNASLSFV
jgi:hypothetical protein